MADKDVGWIFTNMGEIIDYLLIFWVVLAVVVYIVGSILEAQERSNHKRAKQRHKRDSIENSRQSYEQQQQANRYDSDWSPYTNQTTSLNQQYEPQYSASTVGQAYKLNEQPTGSHFYGQQNDLSSSGVYLANNYAYTSPIIDQTQQNYYQHNYDQSAFTQQPPEPSPPVASIPTATGFNSDWVEWVNNVLYLFFSQVDRYSPIVAECICRSLNERLSSRSSSEHGDLIIEFNGINRASSSRPELTNIRTESETDRSVSVTCKIYNKQVSFNLSIRPRTSNNVVNFNSNNNNNNSDSNEYELILENLEGKLKSLAMLNEKLIVIQFIEKPDTKILLKPRHTSASYNASPLINEDTLVQIILQTLTQVMVDLYFGADVDFPRFKQAAATTTTTSTYSSYKNKFNTILRGSASELKKQIKHDFFGALSSSGDKERKVFIKIVRAKNINYNQNVTCLLELDSPHQQAMSSTKQGNSNPYWDEHFLFNVNEKSKELLLELWDSINLNGIDSTASPTSTKKPLKGSSQPLKRWNKNELCRGAKFLGLIGVNIDDLRKNPVQKVDLILEPMETPCNLSNSVGGELQVELLFLEHSASPVPEDQGSRAPTPDSKLRKSQSANSLSYQHGDVVSIDRKLTPSGYVITTTTITKPNQSNSTKQQQEQHLSTMQRNQSPISSLAEHTSLDDINLDGISSSQVGDLSHQQQQQHLRNELTGSPAGTSGPTDRRSEAPSGSAGRLSRSRSRSRSFLRAIKKRFSFSRTRSRSVGESGFVRSTGGDQLGSNLDAISIESRSRASSEVSMAAGGPDGSGRAKSVPASRDPNEVPTIVINKGRLSDTASAFTFTHPKSQLVIEVLEPTLREDGSGNTNKNGRLRYYAIAEGAPNKRKWAKRGVKLHLFNEHQFVACHLAGSSTCHLCGRVFSRRPGKQGYKCRNCHLLSHKQCHVKVDHNCPYAKREGLPLEYIDAEPPASLMDEVGSTGTASQANQQEQTRARPMRMTAKSISMEVDDR